MSLRSSWVETEYEFGEGEVFLVPLRCRLEARTDRLRTIVQRHGPAGWQDCHRTGWTRSKGAHRLPTPDLNAAAEEVADALVDRFAINLNGALEAQWKQSVSVTPATQ